MWHAPSLLETGCVPVKTGRLAASPVETCLRHAGETSGGTGGIPHVRTVHEPIHEEVHAGAGGLATRLVQPLVLHGSLGSELRLTVGFRV